MSTFIPTLSVIGWVKSVEEKADYILSCFITSNFSQSVLYAGNITSLQYLVKKYSGDRLGLETDLKTILENKMNKVFDSNASVDVTVEEDEDNINSLSIRFRCIIVEDGKQYAIGKLVQFINSKIVAIAKINNG